MKARASKAKAKKAAKRPRSDIDSRLASAKTIGEIMDILYGLERSPIQKLRLAREKFHDQRTKNNDMAAAAYDDYLLWEKIVLTDFRESLWRMDGDALIALGKEMNRSPVERKQKELSDRDLFRRLLLLHDGLSSKKDGRYFCDIFGIEGEEKIENAASSFRRIKRRWRKKPDGLACNWHTQVVIH